MPKINKNYMICYRCGHSKAYHIEAEDKRDAEQQIAYQKQYVCADCQKARMIRLGLIDAEPRI